MSSSNIWTRLSNGWAHSTAPVAYHPDLEEAILPQSDDVLQAITTVSEY